jgi:hypothetical protein
MPGEDERSGTRAQVAGSGDDEGRRLLSDVRFPYGSFYEARDRDTEGARRWLGRVKRTAGKGDVPAFWGNVAGFLYQEGCLR